MSLLKEFREFAVKGNVIDLAVGIIIGGAFGKIVASLVADIIMPPVGLAVGGVNFTRLRVLLKEAEGDKAAVTVNYGVFLQHVVDFLIVAWAVFLLVRAINRLRRKEEAKPPPAPPEPSKEEQLLTEIRDLLKKQSA